MGTTTMTVVTEHAECVYQIPHLHICCDWVLCPKRGGVAGPFSLAGLLNWGGAKTGNWRVDKDREDQGTNGGLMGIWKLKRLMT